MKVLKERKYLLFALLALLVIFAGCKGESPTAPTGSGGGGGGIGGGVTPPVGATIVLAVSNATPLVSSTTTITATVTQNNSPVPNGTAVEFSASGAGRFQDTGTSVTIRTTTNGVATAVLTSASAGDVTITAVVNNVSKQTVVTFSAQPVTPPTPDTTVSISGVAPTTGRPEGGELVTITGKNFRTPVRVLFDFGGGVQKEALVTSVTATQVQVLTPAVTIGAGQTLDATISLINEAGTPNEQKATASGPFTYRLAQLTPKFTTLSPDNGPISGGTRITIFGEGFEAPVQVAFGVTGSWAQMQVINVTFNQIIALTPTARDVQPNGSGPLTGPVDLRIININSGTNVTATGVFRYTPKMQITAAGPTQGTSLGGTRVTIDGVGFDDPVAISIGGFAAQPVKVTGTQIIALTAPLASACSAASDVISVTNINNGDSASGPKFTYIAIKPVILSASPDPISPGSTLTVVVQNPGSGNVRFSINARSVIPSPSVITDGGIGDYTFTMLVPADITFPTVQCTPSGGALNSGTQLGTVTAPVVFTNITGGCSTDANSGASITVQPSGANPCILAPTATVSPTALSLPPVASAGATTTTGVFTVSNVAGAQPLTVTASVTAQTNATLTVTPSTATTVNGGTSTTFTVTADPTAPGNFGGTITLTTNDPKNPAITVTVTSAGPAT